MSGMVLPSDQNFQQDRNLLANHQLTLFSENMSKRLKYFFNYKKDRHKSLFQKSVRTNLSLALNFQSLSSLTRYSETSIICKRKHSVGTTGLQRLMTDDTKESKNSQSVKETSVSGRHWVQEVKHEQKISNQWKKN